MLRYSVSKRPHLIDLPTSFMAKNHLRCYTPSILSDAHLPHETEREIAPVAEFYAGKSVFITGGTGFLGKVLIERLLYKCPKINKIYVLIREKRGVNAVERLKIITNNALFSKLKGDRPSDINKLIPIVGDISSLKLGIHAEDITTLIEKVSVVFHSAADVRFNKPLKHIVKVNVEGTKELLDLSRQIRNIQAFVYVSTAFSNADKMTMIEEIVYPPPRNMNEVYEFIENGEVDLKQFLNGKPNTYSFSKALAETVVAEYHGNIPTVIIRPSIVCCTKNEPIPGWLDNWYGATQLVFNASSGLNRVVPGKKTVMMNFIPADYTTNLTIVAAATCRTDTDLKVYNSCASQDTSIRWGSLIDSFKKEYQKLNTDGVNRSKVYFSSSPKILAILTWFIHKAPAYFMDLWLRFNGKEPRYIKELYPTFAVQDAYRYFTSNTFLWNISNAQNLYHSLSPSDRELFPFDPSELNWSEYIKDYCVGVHKYLLARNTDK